MNATIACDVCLDAVSIIDAEANVTNATVAVIGKAIEIMCGLIGGSIVSGECRFIIDSIENISKWLDEGLNRSQICQRLNLC